MICPYLYIKRTPLYWTSDINDLQLTIQQFYVCSIDPSVHPSDITLPFQFKNALTKLL